MAKPHRKLTPRERAEHLEYRSLVNSRAPKSKVLKQCVFAFLTGGTICCIGQLIGDLGQLAFAYDEQARSAFVSISLIFIGALLTGVGVYDRIGTFAGAGSVVPITGFANSIVAPAMEHKREGLVLGVGAQLFSYAGPVLVYGIIAALIVGMLSLIL